MKKFISDRLYQLVLKAIEQDWTGQMQEWLEIYDKENNHRVYSLCVDHCMFEGYPDRVHCTLYEQEIYGDKVFEMLKHHSFNIDLEEVLDL